MNSMTRTIAFVAVAAASVGIATATHWSYQPADPLADVPIGKPFYPDFENPNEATGLRVATYDADAARTKVFSVEFKNGMWRIPSHHNYPADGESRLAKTAASFVGVARKAFVEASPASHERYRLLDPLDESVSSTEGRGDRITLMKGSDPIVDIIVGEQLEGEEGIYYVRRADENAVYTADLGNLDISTKFADWIEPDLLDVSRNDIRELIVDQYQIDEARGVVVQGEKNVLHRDSATADWQLDGIDPKKEKVKSSEIGSTLFALDDLKIVGVRPKPAGLSAELKTQEGMALTPADLIDLQDKGFFVDQQQGRLLSNEGEVIVGTDKGVLYVLRFGEEFSGTDVEIEVGSQGKKQDSGAGEAAKESESSQPGEGDKKAESAEKDADETAAGDASEKEGEDAEPDETKEEDSGLKESRYVFITAQFDDELVGPKPTPPVKPEPPAEQPKADEANSDEPEKKDAKAEADGAADEAAAQAEASESADGSAAKPDPQKEYKKALEEYKLKEEVYQTQLKEYEQKRADGKKKVDELNARFADWYYVISADVFDRLRLKRADIVEPVEAKTDETKAPGAESAPANGASESSTEPAESAASPAAEAGKSAPASESGAAQPDAASPGKQPASDPEAKPASESEETSTEKEGAAKTPASDSSAPAAETSPAPSSEPADADQKSEQKPEE